jgi:N-acetylneuraminate lyase
MKSAGVDCGDCRPPITPFSEREYAELAKDLENIGFPEIK